MPKEFQLPDLGEGIAEAQIVRVLVKEGDTIAEDQYLMEVETDKAAVEIPSPFAGIAKRVHVHEGQTVNVGDVIITIDDGNGSAPPATRQTVSAPAAGKSTATAAPTAKSPGSASASAPSAAPATPRVTTAAAAPAVRKVARELGVDIDRIAGTGPGGRITKADVEAFARGGSSASRDSAGSAPSAPVLAPPVSTQRPMSAPADLPAGTDEEDKWGAVRRVPLNQIRKTIAAHMSKSAFTAVHVTHGDEADISELDRTRRLVNDITQGNPKLTAMTFVIRSLCLTLRRHPILNASFDDERGEIVYKKYIHMGIAVDSQRGLIVPVIRNADQLTMRGIATQLRAIAEQIRSNRFAIEDLRGGTFTITNVGALGGTFSTPIINHPEVAILGLGRSRKVPVLRDGKLEETTILPLNLSFDHRALDGATAARFTTDVKRYLETPALLLLD